jgi:Tol biopolymer transport system component
VRCNGKRVRQLTNDASTHRSPAFSPDGSQIAFWSDQDGLQNIYVMDADGDNLRQLTQGSQNVDPSWSPDGSRIVFVSNRDNPLRWLVYAMDPDGSNVANLGALAQSLQPRPVFSPDGSQIAFASTGTNFTGISVMKPDGTNVENLTPGHPFFARYAVWSLDGRRIAFQGSPDPGHGQPFRVYLIDVGTRELRQLTDFSAEPHAWAWFPK